MQHAGLWRSVCEFRIKCRCKLEKSPADARRVGICAFDGREDLRRIESWLRRCFPTPYPVRVMVRRLPGGEAGARGVTVRNGRRLWIILHERMNWDLSVDTLLHEYAHAAEWRHEAVEARRPDHDDAWALAYGRIYRRFWDEGGRLEALR